MLHYAVGSLLLFLVACSSNTNTTAPSNLPQFEKSATALQKTYDAVTTDADAKLAVLAALDTRHLTLENSLLDYRLGQPGSQ